jgi:molybdate/tungstate transport system ATP-binding protein
MLEIDGLEAEAGEFRLGRIDLAVEPGSYAIVLGPPGSGKSVLIETICGLRPVTRGSIRLGGKDITGLPPRERCIGYVPQDYALFPTERVWKNIIFGLRARGVPTSEIADRTGRFIEMLDLKDLLDRWPRTLSGGEQQRVALARALVTNPRVLLLDEPVSALDESTRDTVCRQLRRIQKDLGITTLHISHNLEEAFSVADVAVLMNRGRVVQTGTMDDLVRRPRTPFAARFLRAQNVFKAEADGATVQLNGLTLSSDRTMHGPIHVMIRPEKIQLRPSPSNEHRVASIPMTIDRSVDRGPYVRVDLAGPLPLVAHVSHRDAAELPREPDAQIYAVIEPQDVYSLEDETDGG